MSEKERELGEKYWEVIEPVWDDISIYESQKHFLNNFKTLVTRRAICSLLTGVNPRYAMEGSISSFGTPPAC